MVFSSSGLSTFFKGHHFLNTVDGSAVRSTCVCKFNMRYEVILTKSLSWLEFVSQIHPIDICHLWSPLCAHHSHWGTQSLKTCWLWHVEINHFSPRLLRRPSNEAPLPVLSLLLHCYHVARYGWHAWLMASVWSFMANSNSFEEKSGNGVSAVLGMGRLMI